MTVPTKIGGLVKNLRGAFLGIGVFSCFINLLMLTGPIYMLQVYDRVLASRSMSTLVSLSLLMIAMYGFVCILDIYRSKVLTRLANKLENDLSRESFEAWVKIGLGQPGPDATSPIQDLGTLRNFLSSNAMATIFDMPWVPIYIAVIFMLHWTLGLFAVFGAVIVILMAIYIEMVAKTPQAEERKYKILSQAIAEQSHRNAGLVQAMGMEGHLYSRWNDLNTEAVSNATHGTDRVGSVRAFSKAFRLLLQSSILGIGAALAIQQIVTPGVMIAGSIILGRALTPAQSLIGQWKLIIAARAARDRLNKVYAVLEMQPERMNLPEPKGHIEVTNVVAGPPKASAPTVMGISFALSPGDGLGIIGPSASGKSTLAKLLVGNWLPQKGDIRLDGATFQQWASGEVGRYMGYLPQDVELFDGTIKDNIARFHPNPSESEVIEAARRANVHELILGLPDGYNTQIGKMGVVLSGGQVQRIALARALYGDPCFVVLDEPNANLDAAGDNALTKAIQGIRQRGKTVIVITHRPSAIAGVNKVLVLGQGKQADFGSKEEVLARMKSGRQTQHSQLAHHSRPQTQIQPQAQIQAQAQTQAPQHMPAAAQGYAPVQPIVHNGQPATAASNSLAVPYSPHTHPGQNPPTMETPVATQTTHAASHTATEPFIAGTHPALAKKT